MREQLRVKAACRASDVWIPPADDDSGLPLFGYEGLAHSLAGRHPLLLSDFTVVIISFNNLIFKIIL